MKAPTQQYRPLFFFRDDMTITRFMAVFMAACTLSLSLSCNYYRVRDVPITQETITSSIQEFNQTHNYALINQSWHLENLVVNEDERSISGTVQLPSEEHRYEKKRNSEKTYRYYKDIQQPFNELHFNVSSNVSPIPGEALTIPFADIQSISVNDKNTGKKTLNIVASTVGVFFATILIYAALKSSCPFVYVKTGEEYYFKGELYPGVITPNMQRIDYLPIGNISPDQGQITIMVTNELREVQRTDLLQLWVAQHDPEVKLALDKNGNLHSFAHLQSPGKLSNRSGVVAEAALLKTDSEYYAFNNDIASATSTRELVLRFDRPKMADKAKLLLTAKNSIWLDYVFGKFNEQFGSYYNTFQKNQQELPKETGEQWAKNQSIPLSVYLKTTKGWELVEQISTVGPMAVRDLAIPLSLEALSGEQVEIKLECGFMFWELDYAGIDYTENKAFTLNKITPDSAIDETGNDVTFLLSQADDQYLLQPEIGNAVTVKFNVTPQEAGFVQTAFLINKGYYNYIRDYDGIPNFKKLKTFRENFAFTRYSENMYKAIVNFEQPKDLASNE